MSHPHTYRERDRGIRDRSRNPTATLTKQGKEASCQQTHAPRIEPVRQRRLEVDGRAAGGGGGNSGVEEPLAAHAFKGAALGAVCVCV